MARSTNLTFSVIIFLFFASNFVANAIPGGRTKVKNVKTNTEIQELGSYSVDEYNQLQRTQKSGAGDLKFSKVVEAETQVVAGTKYYLKIEAFTKSGALKVFDAEVVVKPWAHSKQLLDFKPSPANKHHLLADLPLRFALCAKNASEMDQAGQSSSSPELRRSYRMKILCIVFPTIVPFFPVFMKGTSNLFTEAVGRRQQAMTGSL
ncbi:hypothetical protein L1987_04547 [Smallanthus sonchifolius]|uniref:Uncharacterized protein n=1 Tax=Smallanthus sonchifolius TaxID=185202 RepID=A0ACB9JSX5_9ASTR|nr:hypothetical protein L1987_04547 [Smallanthus sonchifolius]